MCVRICALVVRVRKYKVNFPPPEIVVRVRVAGWGCSAALGCMVAPRGGTDRDRLFRFLPGTAEHVLVIYIFGVYAYGSKAPEPGWPSLQTSGDTPERRNIRHASRCFASSFTCTTESPSGASGEASCAPPGPAALPLSRAARRLSWPPRHGRRPSRPRRPRTGRDKTHT